MLDKWHKVCYNIIIKGQGRCESRLEEIVRTETQNFFEKVFQNPLTKGTKCAIIITEGKGSDPKERERPRERVRLPNLQK